MSHGNPFAEALDAAEQLDLDAQAELVAVLSRRLAARGRERVAATVAQARRELAAESEFDLTLVNTSVQEVCRQVVTLVFGSPDEC